MTSFWLTVLTWTTITNIVNGWGTNSNSGTAVKCERLSVSFCRGLRYNLTAMPNFIGHEDQKQAERGLATFMPLVHYNCSRHLRLFLCAVFAPVCSEHIAMQIPACKSLCLSVRRDCEPALTSLTLPWPHMLDCDRFLDRGNTLCVQPPEEPQSGSIAPVVPTVQNYWPLKDETSFPVHSYSSARQRCPKNFIPTPNTETSSCSPVCGTDSFYRSEDKLFAERWMTGWAWTCFVSSLFTLLTFWAEPSRFRYPERPIVFIALSCNLLCVTFILRGAIGPEILSCVNQQNGANYIPIHDGLRSGPCTVWWLSKHYFELVSSCWWTILCCCWLLSARNEWSSEALHNIAIYLHIAAWGLPAFFTIGSLLARDIVADELTGTCTISDESAFWLEVLPHGIVLFIGCLFTSFAGTALFRVRRAIRSTGRSAVKLERLMTRLGIFAFLYVLPALGRLVCTLHQTATRPKWRTRFIFTALECSPEKSCGMETIYTAAGMEVSLLKILLSLVIGLTSGIWVWSGKTCRTWSKILAAPSKPIKSPQIGQHPVCRRQGLNETVNFYK